MIPSDKRFVLRKHYYPTHCLKHPIHLKISMYPKNNGYSPGSLLCRIKRNFREIFEIDFRLLLIACYYQFGGFNTTSLLLKWIGCIHKTSIGKRWNNIQLTGFWKKSIVPNIKGHGWNIIRICPGPQTIIALGNCRGLIRCSDLIFVSSKKVWAWQPASNILLYDIDKVNNNSKI